MAVHELIEIDCNKFEPRSVAWSMAPMNLTMFGCGLTPVSMNAIFSLMSDSSAALYPSEMQIIHGYWLSLFYLFIY